METATADERITISQKTGYIQIKKRSASVDQHPMIGGGGAAVLAPVKEIKPPVPLPVPASVVAPRDGGCRPTCAQPSSWCTLVFTMKCFMAMSLPRRRARRMQTIACAITVGKHAEM